MSKLSLALALGLSLAAFPAAAFDGCGGFAPGHAQAPETKPVATTQEATKPATVAGEHTQSTTTAQVPTPSPTAN